MTLTQIRPVPPVDAGGPLLEVIGAEVRVDLSDGRAVRHVNLDYAATSPALASVAERVAAALPEYASVHRGAGVLSRRSTARYEAARATIAAFAGARADDVCVVTRNTTDALGLLASAVPAGPGAGDVLFLDSEHHANLLPWRALAHREIAHAPTIAETLERVEAALAARPAALLAVTGASNVTGEILPIARLAALAHAYGARIAVDAAQLAPHRPLDLAGWDADYVAFSGHKTYAPFSTGALVGRRDWLDAAPPYLLGGGATEEVRAGETVWRAAPERHEGGTPNLLGAVALAAACDVLAGLAPGALVAHEDALRARLVVDGLDRLPGVRTHRIWADSCDAVGVVAFTVEGRSPAAVSEALSAAHGIGLRAGRFCAHPLLARLDLPDGALRASFGVGTTTADVDRLLHGLEELVG